MRVLLTETEIISTPVQEIYDVLFEQHKVRVFIKREELCHPVISGNKWHKLRLNLQAAKAQGFKKILSFGGAYSNHIHALAYVCQQQGLQTTGIIRGEELAFEPLNPCLSDAEAWGMDLHFISRENYRQKKQQHFIDSLRQKFGDFYLIPEGGANALAVLSCSEFAKDCFQQAEQSFDYVVLSCGTGCTLAGFVAGLNQMHHQKKISVQGFLAVNDQANINDTITELIKTVSCFDDTQSDNFSPPRVEWSLNSDYVLGGYGKQSRDLIDFMESFCQQQGILLDPVYTGKMLFGLYDQIRQGMYPEQSHILVLHSGGLQGLRSEY